MNNGLFTAVDSDATSTRPTEIYSPIATRSTAITYLRCIDMDLCAEICWLGKAVRADDFGVDTSHPVYFHCFSNAASSRLTVRLRPSSQRTLSLFTYCLHNAKEIFLCVRQSAHNPFVLCSTIETPSPTTLQRPTRCYASLAVYCCIVSLPLSTSNFSSCEALLFAFRHHFAAQ